MLQALGRWVGRSLRDLGRGFVEGVGKAFPNDTSFGTMVDVVRSVLGEKDSLSSPMEQNATAYRSIRTIADNLALPPVEVRRGDRKQYTVVEGHPVAERLRRPNDWQDWPAFLKLLATWHALDGAVAIYAPGRMSLEIPPKMELVRADRKRWDAIVDKELGLIGWRYRPAKGGTVVFSLEEVLMLWDPHPKNPFDWIAPHDSALIDMDADRMAAIYNRAFFRNGCVPGGHLLLKHGSLSDDEYESFKKRWIDSNGGAANAFQFHVLEGGMEFLPSEVTHREAEFLSLRQFTTEQVAMVYGVPHEVLGLGKKTFENVDAAWRNFWGHNLDPRLRWVGAALTRWLGLEDQGLWVDFDRSDVKYLQEDLTEKLAQAISLQQLRYTQNQINERLSLGMPDDNPWGDEDPQSFGGLLPEDPDPDEDEEIIEDEEDEDGDEEDQKALGARRDLALLVDVSDEDGRGLLPGDVTTCTRGLPMVTRDAVRKLDRKAALYEKKVRSKMRDHYKALEREVLKNLRARRSELPEKATKKITAEDILFDLAAADSAIQRRLARTILSVMRDGALSAREETGGDTGGWKMPAAVLQTHRARINKIRIVNRTIGKAIRKKVGAKLSEMATIQEVTDAVKDTFGLARANSLRIARTEVQGALNEARAAQYEADDVERLRWLSSRDGAVRSSHRIHGQERDLGTRFSNGLRWPGDQTGPAEEVINCRCRPAAVPAEDYFSEEDDDA